MRLGTRFGKIAVRQNDEPADVGEFLHRYAVVGRGVRLLRLRGRSRWSAKGRCRAWNRCVAARRNRRCASFVKIPRRRISTSRRARNARRPGVAGDPTATSTTHRGAWGAGPSAFMTNYDNHVPPGEFSCRADSRRHGPSRSPRLLHQPRREAQAFAIVAKPSEQWAGQRRFHFKE